MLLLKRGEWLVAGSNIVLSVIAGLLALWLGLGMASLKV
jgi:fluoride ion exporter CrcB/FEX